MTKAFKKVGGGTIIATLEPPTSSTTISTMEESLSEKEEELAFSNMHSKRGKVYKAIDSERDYQNEKWGATLSSDRPGNGERSIDEFTLYIQGYSYDLTNEASHFGDAESKLNIIRKIAGLCGACMEQHGAPLRNTSRFKQKK